MCLQSCHRAVITDWAVLVLVLSFSLIKVGMKPQPVQISLFLFSSFCFICNFKTCHTCVWDNSCSSFHCKIKEWTPWALWCAVGYCLSPRVLFMNSCWWVPPFTPHPPPFHQYPLIVPFHSSAYTYCDRVFLNLFFLLLFNQSIGFKPDKSPGDTAAWVFTLH